MASPTPSWIWPVFNSRREESEQWTWGHRKEPFSSEGQCCSTTLLTLQLKTEDTLLLQWNIYQSLNKTLIWELKCWFLVNLLGLVFGEMVTNRLIIPGDCCIGGVRHSRSSFSVVGVISSPTRILSRLPSSTPFPNHRPQGNLQNKLFIFAPDPRGQQNTVACSILFKNIRTCKCAPWSRCGPQRTPPATLRRVLSYHDPSALWSASQGSGTDTEIYLDHSICQKCIIMFKDHEIETWRPQLNQDQHIGLWPFDFPIL